MENSSPPTPLPHPTPIENPPPSSSISTTESNIWILASKDTSHAKWLFQTLIKSQSPAQSPAQSWKLCLTRDDLSQHLTPSPTPKGIIFFHWNYIVPAKIYENYNCYVIHTSNLPKGRGGSPIQNSIIRDEFQSRVNLIKMVKELDAGDLYDHRSITLQGTLDDIWHTIARAASELCLQLSHDLHLIFHPQEGLMTTNRRIKDNQLPMSDPSTTPKQLYDRIRMLDGEGYPNPYLEIGSYRLEFNRAKFDHQNETILADVRIMKKS